MKRFFVLIVFLAALSLSAGAQSKSFTLGQWVEIHNAILKELNRSYVDSLPVGRIEREGIDAMLESLDPYTVYVPEEEQEDFRMMIGNTYGGIGAIINKPSLDSNVIISEPYAGSPAVRSGIGVGDEIVEIDGKTVKGINSSEASDRMKGKPGTTVAFKVIKMRGGPSWAPGDTVDIKVVRERIHLPDVEYAGMLNDTTGYILQTKFTEGVSAAVKERFLDLKSKGMKKFILDLRGNGGGLLVEAVSEVALFVPKGSIVVTSKGNSDRETQVLKTQTDPVDLNIPIVVLVNSSSASASEIVSGALQDLDRATIMGTRTFGKGLVQSIRPLPYSGQLKVTTAKYYTPSGRCVQAIDYSRRNEDGSVGHIPDSLTHEFKTVGGRTVRDGGGITPDVVIPSKEYGRLTYSVVMNLITDRYALEYYRKHESIPPVDEFHLTDEEYEDFVEFAADKEFDYRSSAKAMFDEMKKTLVTEGLAEGMADELSALEKSLNVDKKTFLRMKKDEILPFVEEDIVVRYYFQEAGVKLRLRTDDQLKKALETPCLKF